MTQSTCILATRGATPTGHRRRLSRHRCGGSIYLAVLGAAMLVALIGVSGVLVNRAQYDAARTAESSAQAQALARSAVELGIARIAAAPSWRSDYTADGWSTPQSLGAGTVSFKLVDPVDSSLSDDASDAVRVVGRGRSGDAMRMCSVLLKMDATAPGGIVVVAGSWKRIVQSP